MLTEMGVEELRGFLARLATSLGCEATPLAISVAIGNLRGRAARMEEMLAKVRHVAAHAPDVAAQLMEVLDDM